MSELPPPKRTPINIDELPWYKSPYTWAFIIGIVTLTLLRPCTRHVPEPMPSLGEVPAWLSGVSATLGGATLLTFYVERCAPCEATIAGLTGVTRELSRTPYEPHIQVVVAHPPGVSLDAVTKHYAYEPRWSTLEVEIPDLWQRGGFARALVDGEPLDEDLGRFLTSGAVWIVDDAGALRGPLGAATDEAANETLHRVQHVARAKVIDDARAR